jgi:PAS domain S-box-containing protein
MTDEPTRILLVEDEPAHAELVRRAFEARGQQSQLQVAETLAEVRRYLSAHAGPPHLVISDWRLPDGDGMELLTDDRLMNVPVIIMTSQGNERVAVDALKAGALDYVVKSETTLLDMPHIAERVLREWEIRAERERIQQALRASEEKFNKAFRSSPVAMSISDDITRHYLEVNDAFVKLTGYPREELIGHTARDLNLWVDLNERTAVMHEMAQQGFVHGHEVHFQTRSREIRTALLSLESVELKGALCLLTTVYDITERRQAEDALRESEQKFRAIIEQSAEGFLLIDGAGRIVEWNQAQARISGIPHEEAVGRFFWDVQLRMTVAERRTPAQLAYFKQTALEALHSGESPMFNRPLEAVLEKPTGERRFISQTIFPVRSEEGLRIGSITSDITERKQAEEALRASEDRFRSLVQNSQDIITVHDQNFVVTYESPSVSRLLGYEPGYLIGKSPLDFMPVEDRPVVRHAFEEVVHHLNANIPTEFRFQRADGSLVYLDALGANLLDHPGVRGIVITSRDMTERKRTERALRQYAERLSILHEIDQAILTAKSIEEIADAALSRIQRSISSWRAKITLFDFEAEQAVVVAYYCDGTKLPAGERLPLAALGPLVQLRSGELYVINDLSELLNPSLSQLRQIGDGARSSIDAPLIVLGQQIGLLGVDATQWDAFQGEVAEVVREAADQLAVAIQNARLLEQTQWHARELEQRVAERTRELAMVNERLTELDRLKSKFVSDVSHELRTPIANLKLHVELLEHGRPEKREHYLSVVKQQSRRLGQLVDDILNLSRLEMGGERAAFGPVDLNLLAEQIVVAHQPRAESNGLTLTFEPLLNLQPVRGEVNQLSQVVTNLVINALNYTPDGRVRVTTFQTTEEACLQVEDTGIGIDPEDLPNIFDRFYRGRRSQRSETPGTGLGLAIVKEIVDLHDGHIDVDSQVRQGTTFKVWLPLFCDGDIS